MLPHLSEKGKRFCRFSGEDGILSIPEKMCYDEGEDGGPEKMATKAAFHTEQKGNEI